MLQPVKLFPDGDLDRLAPVGKVSALDNAIKAIQHGTVECDRNFGFGHGMILRHTTGKPQVS